MSLRAPRCAPSLLLLLPVPLLAPPLPAAGSLLDNGGFKADALGHLAVWSKEAGGPIDQAARFFSLPIIGALLGVIAAGVLILLGLAMARRARTRGRRPARRPKITIEDLLYGYGVPGGPNTALDAFTQRGGHRRESARVEHRRTPRIPFAAPVTVKRLRGTGKIDLLRLESENISDWGIFLAAEDLTALNLDEEVGLEIHGEGGTVDLGKAVVTRVRAWEDGWGGKLRGGFGLRFLLPPHRIRRLRRSLDRRAAAPPPSQSP